MSEQIPTLLNVNAVAKAWGKKPWSIYRMAREGLIPSVKIGRAVMFSPDVIRSHIENSRCENPKNQPAA